MLRIALAVLYLSLSATAMVTPEETIVRNAYAKLSYAVDLETVYRATLTNPHISPDDLAKLVEKEGLRFSLSNFVVGNFSAISDDKWISIFPQYPDGQDVIQLPPVKEQLIEAGKTIQMDVTTAQWTKQERGTPPDWTVAQALPIVEKESGIATLVRYVKYEVTVSLNGRSRSYRASFFLSPTGQAAPADTVVGLGGGAMAEFLITPVYPNLLLDTSLWRKSAAVRSYVLSNQKTQDSCKSGDACCDTATLQCGVYSGDVAGMQP